MTPTFVETARLAIQLLLMLKKHPILLKVNAKNVQKTQKIFLEMLKEEIPNQFYIGLHRQGHSPTGKWMWYTFGGNDMPV